MATSNSQRTAGRQPEQKDEIPWKLLFLVVTPAAIALAVFATYVVRPQMTEKAKARLLAAEEDAQRLAATRDGLTQRITELGTSLQNSQQEKAAAQERAHKAEQQAVRLRDELARALERAEEGEASANRGQNGSTPIVCNTFDLTASIAENALEWHLDTDLPNHITIMVSVERHYWEQGDSSTYVADYLSDKATVGEWRDRRIELDNEAWLRKFRENRERQAALGLAGEIREIGDYIVVGATIPIGQGIESGLADKIGAISRDVRLDYPLSTRGHNSAKADPLRVNPQELKAQRSYRLSEETPLMPEFEPADPLAAIAKMRKIRAGSVFTVLEVRTKRGTPWYRVRVDRAEGWINSTALLAQRV